MPTSSPDPPPSVPPLLDPPVSTAVVVDVVGVAIEPSAPSATWSVSTPTCEPKNWTAENAKAAISNISSADSTSVAPREDSQSVAFPMACPFASPYSPYAASNLLGSKSISPVAQARSFSYPRNLPRFSLHPAFRVCLSSDVDPDEAVIRTRERECTGEREQRVGGFRPEHASANHLHVLAR